MAELLNEYKQNFIKGLESIKDLLMAGKEIDVVLSYLNLLVYHFSLLVEQGNTLTAEQNITKSLVEALAQINIAPLSKEEWLNFNEYLMQLSKTILQAALAEVNNGKDQKSTA